MKKDNNDEAQLKKAQITLQNLYDKKLLYPNEIVFLVSGLECAIIGVSHTLPKKIIYDYWVALDILIKQAEYKFDDAQDWLDNFSQINNRKNNHQNVFFVKTLKPNLDY